jgi:hypothetical protein
VGEMALKCPYCGNKTEPKQECCSVCGGPVGEIILPAESAANEIPGKAGTSRMVSAIVYIVIVLVVLSVPAYLTIRTVVDVTTTEVDLSVTHATVVADPFHTPAAGYRFVHLTATIANRGESTIALSPSEFHVWTADQSYYSSTDCYDNIVPMTLTGKSTATLSITFEVPSDKTPTRLSYQRFMTSDVIESAIATVDPAIVNVTLDMDSPYVVFDSSKDGFKCVQVGFNMTNSYDESIGLVASEFRLQTSSGAVCDCSSAASDEAFQELDAGTTRSISIVVEIAVTDSPALLIFECGGVHVEQEVL